MVEFSESAKGMRSSEIRRLMKLAVDPSIISFSGGMPANDLFPITVVDELYQGLTLSEKQIALQYGPTSGYPPLLESLTLYLQSRGLSMENQSLLITTGAQQAINLLAKVLIDPGDLVITENPSFIGAIAAFQSYGANLSAIPMDSEGIDLEALAREIDSRTSQIKMLYLNPCFQNPSGIIYSEKRKRDLLDLVRGRSFCLLEDDPYSELYFSEDTKKRILPMKSTDSNAFPICYVGTFAKILGPGLRLGWLLGPEKIVEKCELAKQSMDACSATFTQVLAHKFLSEGKLQPYVSSLRVAYKRRAECMLGALAKNMPESVTWTVPEGGFYIWVTLPETMDATIVFERAFKRGAAFVIGSAFDPHGVRNNCMRLAYSFTPEDKIAEGIAIIASAIKELL